MRTSITFSMLILSGCGATAEDGPSPETDAAVQAANDTVAAAALSTQSAAWVTENGLRAACPTVYRDGGMQQFTVTVDYGAGCVPTHGLLDAEMSGSLTVDYASQALTVTFDELAADEASVDGSIQGTWARVGADGAELGLDSALQIGGDTGVVQTLDVALDPRDVVFDGETVLDAPEGTTHTVSDAVVLAYVDALGPCPLPHGGTVRVDTDGSWVEVRFLQDTPQTGEVEVTVAAGTFTVPLCDTPSELY